MFGLGGRKQSGPNLGAYATTVEQILLSIGVDPVQARMNIQTGFAWNFQRGSALIEIYISQHENMGYMQVLSPIIHLPQTGLLPLYRRLLEMNLQLTNAAFGVYLDVLYIFSERLLDGMDAAEANAIISMVAAYADEWDDRMVAEFGGRLYSRI